MKTQQFILAFAITFLALPLAAQQPVKLFIVPGSEYGVAWGNGTGAEVNDYTAIIDNFNRFGVSVVAATTGQAEDGADIILAGQILRELGHRRIIACGHSQGAAGALNAVALEPELFDAVCPIMPGRDALPSHIPCFLISAQYDVKAAPWLIERRIVRDYPGPILHSTKLGIGHFGVNNSEVLLRSALFSLNDDRWLDIRTNRGWDVVTDRY